MQQVPPPPPIINMQQEPPPPSITVPPQPETSDEGKKRYEGKNSFLEQEIRRSVHGKQFSYRPRWGI